MAEAKVSAFTEETSPALTDDLYLLKSPGGTPASKRVTIQKIVDLAPSGVFTPTTGGDWTGPPATIQEAADELAGRVTTLEATPGGSGIVLSATVTLNNADIIALPTTPVQIVAAPGANKILLPIMAMVKTDPVAGIYTDIETGAVIGILHADGAGMLSSIDATVLGVAAIRGSNVLLGAGTFLPSAFVNKGLSILMDNQGGAGALGGGDAANSLVVTVYYAVVDF